MATSSSKRSLIPSPTTDSTLISPSLRKHHPRYDDSSSSDYSTDEEDYNEEIPPQTSNSSSNGSILVIFLLIVLLCIAAVTAVYFWNENRNGSSSSSDGGTTKTVATTLTPTATKSTVKPADSPSNSSNISSRTSSSIATASNSKPTTKVSSSNNDSNSKPSSTSPSPSTDSTSPSSSTSTPDTPSSSTIVPQDLVEILLKTHNDFRKLHQVSPLDWNETLSESSDRWVNNCVFEHSGGKLLQGGYGENLFAVSGTNSAEDTPVDGKAGVDAWNSEISMYNYDPPTGFTHETGHVTQTIWKGTKTVGCQYKNCKGLFSSGQWGSYLVCQYYPPGNYEGQYLENVLPPLE